jgi:hypothetical protein
MSRAWPTIMYRCILFTPIKDIANGHDGVLVIKSDRKSVLTARRQSVVNKSEGLRE